jgi:hypothetical protein
MDFTDYNGKPIVPGSKVVIATQNRKKTAIRTGVVYRLSGHLDGAGKLSYCSIGVMVDITRDGRKWTSARSYTKNKNMLVVG